jgi:hypothetical protein
LRFLAGWFYFEAWCQRLESHRKQSDLQAITLVQTVDGLAPMTRK